MQVALLLVIVWLSSFGIAFGVQEWRQRDDPNAALLAQAEACRSAVSWWNALKDFSDQPAFTAFKAMVAVCGELNTSSEPDAEEN